MNEDLLNELKELMIISEFILSKKDYKKERKKIKKLISKIESGDCENIYLDS